MPSSFKKLLEDSLDATDCSELLAEIGFEDAAMALTRIRAVAGTGEQKELFRTGLPMLMSVLRDAPSPDVSLVNFERFVLSADDRIEVLEYLASNPRAIEMLVRLFVGSQFLTEILIQNPHYLRELTLHNRIADFKSRQDFVAQAHATIEAGLLEPLDALRHFQRWELLRIGACDAFGLMDLRSVTRQLSLLADAVVQTALDVLANKLGIDPAGFSVVAMGKLGGNELNYSSDIDLIFLSRNNPQNFWQLGQQLIVALTETSPHGFLYRVDMRLRPWGQSGALVNSVDSHIEYLTKQGELWEKQALLKARVIAGDVDAGSEFIQRVAPIVFTSSPAEVREDVLASKLRIEQHLDRTGTTWGDVKSGRGSIRDIEFTTQYLQLVNGGLVKDVRAANTLDGLVRLADFGFLHANEYRILSDAYGLLRTIEHSLQLMHSQQTHTLPKSDRRLGWLARRLDFMSANQLREHYDECSAQVRRIFDKYVLHGGTASQQNADTTGPVGAHLRKMGQSYTEVFDKQQIAEHARLLETLSVTEPVAVEITPVGRSKKHKRWRLTVIGRDHPGCLSIISGLMVACGIDIVDGHVFTGIKLESTPGRARRFVDTFVVRCLETAAPDETFAAYESQLHVAMAQLYAGDFDEARSGVLSRVSQAMFDTAGSSPVLAVEISVDNESGKDFTVLKIESVDTIGLLYELTNALTLSGVHVEQVQLQGARERVYGTLHITREDGSRITDERGIQQLRAAIVLIKHFTHLLPQSSNPRRALRQFREFLEEFFNRENWVEELSSLERTDVLDALARLLGVSRFLWMDFLRLQHENLFPVVRDVGQLEQPRTKTALADELATRLADCPDSTIRRAKLNAFKDREMFRVDMRHIMDHCRSFTQFSGELSDVADVTVAAAVQYCLDELFQKYGHPMLEDGVTPCAISVCALGKCGGRELGFASDIELMFVYERAGRTSGKKSIPNSSLFEKLVKRFSAEIQARQDGIFELDLRLRPYGQAGSEAVELSVFSSYFAADGAAWPFERQALVKLRPIAGDAALGQRVIGIRDQIVFQSDWFDRAAMLAMREKQIRQLIAPGTINAKLSSGGLVDCEYLVQALQIKHGRQHEELRLSNTRHAIDTLGELSLVTANQHERLQASHRFLRLLIDAMRVVRGNARDLTVPPYDSTDFAFLARHLKFGRSIEGLQEELNSTLIEVNQLVTTLL